MNTQERTLPYAVVILVAIAIAAIVVAIVSLSASGSPQSAAAVDPHDPCDGIEDPVDPVNPDEATFDAGTDIISGVCIKAGNMFGGNHSQVFTQDEQNIEDCYDIEGIGTSSVTVTRTGEEGPECQGISHIDVNVTTPTPTPTPTATPTPTPSPGAEASPTPTPTALAAVQEPEALAEVQEPEALPASGGTPADGSGLGILPLLLALSGLAFLGGAGTLVAVKVRSRR